MEHDLTKPAEGYTDEEWTDLSDAEREGIYDSLTPDDTAPDSDLDEDALKKIADEPGEDKDKKDGEDKKTEPTKDDVKKEEDPLDSKSGDPPDTPKDDATPPVAADGEPPLSPEVSDDALLAYRPVVTAAELKHDEVIPDDLQTKLDELKTKYDAGDIAIHEYSDQRDAINRQIFKHNSELEQAAREDLVWKKEQLHFLKARPEYLPGEKATSAEKIKANAMYGALSEMVKTLAADETLSGLTGMQLLVRADAEVKKVFGLASAKPIPVKPDEKRDADPGKPPAARPDHKTLTDVPAAGVNDNDAFAQLDKLTGEPYEAALERLDPAVREAYESRV